MMRSLLLLLLSLLLILPAAKAQPTDKEAMTWPEKEALIRDYCQNYFARKDLPALAVAVIKEGQAELQILLGQSDRASGTPIQASTFFQLGSLSKMFTGLITRKMILAGLLEPEKSVGDYLAGLLTPAGQEKWSTIAVRDLLHHRAGLPNHGPGTPPTPNGTAMRGGYSRQALLQDMEDLVIPEDANESFTYSNFGYAILALILEEVSSQPYESLLQAQVITAFELEHTSSRAPQAEVATPYFIGARRKATQAWEMGYEKAAGGIFSNLEDLKQLLGQQLEVYRQKETGHPLYLSSDQRPMTPDGKRQYGYGMMQIPAVYDTSVWTFQHGGDLDGFASQYKLLPDQQMGYLILTSSGGTWINELDILIEQVLLGTPPRKVAELNKKELKRFTGKYRFPSGQEFQLERKGDELYCLFPGVDPMQVYPESAKRLFFRSMNVQVDFPAEGASADSITYWQNGQAFRAAKVR